MEINIDRKQRNTLKLRDLLRKQRRESEGQLDAFPDVDFIYHDSDRQSAEIAELYSYTEEIEFKFNREAFETTLFSQGHDKWTRMQENDHKKFVFYVFEKCEAVDPCARLNAARSLLYLVQGNFGEVSDEEEQREWSLSNVLFLYKMGLMPLLFQLLNVEIENADAALSALHKPAISMADSVTLRVYLNIIYTVVEVIRNIEVGESEKLKKVQESFFNELSQPCGNDELLPIVLLEMVLKFCAGSCPHFPIKKILLLLWKTILVFLGGIEELAKGKEEARIAAGLPASYELQCPPQQPVINERTPAPHTPPPSYDSDNNGEIIWDRSEEEQEAVRPPKLRPKVRQKDVDIFLDNTRNKFVGFQLRGDSQTIAGLPGPIHEGLSILKKHMYVSLSELQIQEEEDASNRPFTKGNVKVPFNAVEQLYEAMLPNLPQYMIALLKILLAAAPTAKAKTESINILADVLPEDMPSTVLHSMRLGIDVNRHKEIIVKAISGVLFLLLKHFKLNHVYQFEFISQHLVFANCIPLILKFLNQNISAFISAKNTIPQLDFPACILGDPLELTAESLENADQEACCWRNLYSCINLLRILQKLTKWKHSRTMMLVVFKSAPILKRALKVKHEVLQLYVLKLLKAQTKYLGRNWRKSNMKTMSAIYQKVRHRLNDDWAYGNDLDARPWDFQADECALRACVDRFNNRRYGIENGDRIDGSEEDEYLPVDNDILSVLGEKVELSNEFKNNYERWLDREVFSVSIDWDQLCTCDMTAESPVNSFSE
ncbi:striatin-interacting protein 1-like [Acropora palmata]|uniref:striatin-interacting protein 1-like n=1 Tax=Acropora palmata TaxID=6131 RepID=UPI003D9FF893